MDYLFVRLIDRFRAVGCSGMNLGFAPLSGLEGLGVVARALRLLYVYGGRGVNFHGLRAFKEKRDPRRGAPSLGYRSGLDLPRIALAVVRVGERSGDAPWSPRRWLLRHNHRELQPPEGVCCPTAHLRPYQPS